MEPTKPIAEAARARSRAAASALLPTPARPLEPGTTLGPYTLGELLGRGGTATVFAAHDQRRGRAVALKILRADATEALGERARRRLMDEARTLARVSHPGIVRVFDVGVVGEYSVIAMERVHGRTLTRWLDAKPRTPTQVVAVIEQVGEALAAAHRAGVVHRDVKPANIMVRDDGGICLLDFGIARDHDDPTRTASSVVMGTLGYVAPERLHSTECTPHSDQYGLAATLWSALIGTPPESEPGPLPPRDRHGAPISPAMARVVERGLAREPSGRFESMQALVGALARARSPWRRTLWLVGVGVVVLLGVVGWVLGGG